MPRMAPPWPPRTPTAGFLRCVERDVVGHVAIRSRLDGRCDLVRGRDRAEQAADIVFGPFVPGMQTRREVERFPGPSRLSVAELEPPEAVDLDVLLIRRPQRAPIDPAVPGALLVDADAAVPEVADEQIASELPERGRRQRDVDRLVQRAHPPNPREQLSSQIEDIDVPAGR